MNPRFCAICTNTLHEVPETKQIGKPRAEKIAPHLANVSATGSICLSAANRSGSGLDKPILLHGREKAQATRMMGSGSSGMAGYAPRSKWALTQIMRSLERK